MGYLKVNPEDVEKAQGRESFSAFIPHPLRIEGRSELDPFPFNILFQSCIMSDGQPVSASALYEPEFHTFHKEESRSSMRQHTGARHAWNSLKLKGNT